MAALRHLISQLGQNCEWHAAIECHAEEAGFHSAGEGVVRPFRQDHGSSRGWEISLRGGDGRETLMRVGTLMRVRTLKLSIRHHLY